MPCCRPLFQYTDLFSKKRLRSLKTLGAVALNIRTGNGEWRRCHVYRNRSKSCAINN